MKKDREKSNSSPMQCISQLGDNNRGEERGKKSVSNCCSARKRKKLKSKRRRRANGIRAVTNTRMLVVLYADFTTQDEIAVNQEVVILRLESGRKNC
jgi:hypothetical protein